MDVPGLSAEGNAAGAWHCHYLNIIALGARTHNSAVLLQTKQNKQLPLVDGARECSVYVCASNTAGLREPSRLCACILSTTLA